MTIDNKTEMFDIKGKGTIDEIISTINESLKLSKYIN